jgi:hypothetical protein
MDSRLNKATAHRAPRRFSTECAGFQNNFVDSAGPSKPRFAIFGTFTSLSPCLIKKLKRRKDFSSRRWFLWGQNSLPYYLMPTLNWIPLPSLRLMRNVYSCPDWRLLVAMLKIHLSVAQRNAASGISVPLTSFIFST